MKTAHLILATPILAALALPAAAQRDTYSSTERNLGADRANTRTQRDRSDIREQRAARSTRDRFANRDGSDRFRTGNYRGTPYQGTRYRTGDWREGDRFGSGYRTGRFDRTDRFAPDGSDGSGGFDSGSGRFDSGRFNRFESPRGMNDRFDTGGFSNWYDRNRTSARMRDRDRSTFGGQADRWRDRDRDQFGVADRNRSQRELRGQQRDWWSDGEGRFRSSDWGDRNSSRQLDAWDDDRDTFRGARDRFSSQYRGYDNLDRGGYRTGSDRYRTRNDNAWDNPWDNRDWNRD